MVKTILKIDGGARLRNNPESGPFREKSLCLPEQKRGFFSDGGSGGRYEAESRC